MYFKEVIALLGNKRDLTPAQKLVEKKLNSDSDTDERSEVSEAKKLIDKEIEEYSNK